MINIGVNELKPFLRFARFVDVTPEYSYNGIVSYDARIAFAAGGKGILNIGGRDYRMCPGALISWPAGREYGFSDISDSPLKLMMLNLDYAGDSPSGSLLIPDKPGDFDESRIAGSFALTENADDNGVLYDGSAFYAEPSMRELLLEYRERRIYSPAVTGGLLAALLAKLCRNVRLGGVRGGLPDEIISYITTHLGEKLTYQSLGAVFSYHPNHINRMITRGTGVPLHRYLLRLRMERAYALLCDDGKTVSEVAGLCGFPDATSFSKRFRLETGFTPSEVRRRSR